MAATGRLGRVYVWTGSGWVDVGTVRNVTYRSEPQLGERDAFGRAAVLSMQTAVEFTLLQTTETEHRNALDSAGQTTSVFIGNDVNATPPANPDASPTNGLILKDAGFSVTSTLDLGGGESFITVRLTRRSLSGDPWPNWD